MQSANKENQDKPLKLMAINAEERRNLVGFFELLLKVDKRNNPENYNS